MNKPTIDVLAERVERLERENRQLRRGSAAVVALLIPLCVGAAALQADRAVRAREFALVGEDGKPRAVLGWEDNKPALRFLDGRGKARLVIDETGLVGSDGELNKR